MLRLNFAPGFTVRWWSHVPASEPLKAPVSPASACCDSSDCLPIISGAKGFLFKF